MMNLSHHLEWRFIEFHQVELSAVAQAAHEWYADMGGVAARVIEALDKARGPGPVFMVFLSIHEQDALALACCLRLRELAACRPFIDRAAVAALSSALLRIATAKV